MKILNIHFKNINSLEGENEIDFERAPFSDSGVFAITGPNGSGKSSILDAITLGLYGETFRFDRPAKHVMTKHTSECFSEVAFMVDKIKYRSTWRVQRSENNPEAEPQLPEMILIRLDDGEKLAESSQQVCTRITEITGMNFRNFTRSIMLAQGDFAAFLNALDTERMDILEKIVSADIYTDYKNEITARATQEQQRLDNLKQDLSILPVLPPEQLEALNLDLTDFIEQQGELKERQSLLKGQQVLANNVRELHSRINDQEQQLRQTETEAVQERQQLDKLLNAQDALLFKDDVNAIKEKNHQLHQSKSELSAIRNELTQIQSHLETNKSDDRPLPESLPQISVAEQSQTISSIRSRIGQLTARRQSETDLWQSLSLQLDEKSAALSNVTKWLEDHSADKTLLEHFPEIGRLKRLRTELAELKAKQKEYDKWSKNTSASLKNTKSAIQQENKRIVELKLKLPGAERTLNELAQGRTLQELEELRQEQIERVKNFRELFKLAKIHKKLNRSGFSFFGLFKPNNESIHNIEEMEAALEALKQEIEREDNIRLTLETAVFRENLLKKMASDRQYLNDGEPCFLCGALEHPYSKHPPKEADSKQALADQKAKIKALKLNGGKLSQQIKTAQKKVANNEANQDELLKIRSQWLKLCNRLNTSSEDLNINKIRMIKGLLRTEINELKAVNSVVTGYRNKQAAIEQIHALIEKGQATVKRLESTGEQLEAEWQNRPDEEVEYEKTLVNFQQEEQQLAEKVMEQLALLGEKMPSKKKEDLLYDRLNARRQEYQSYVFRHKNLSEDLENFKSKIDHCQTEVTACNETLEQLTKQLQNEEFVGLHLAIIEKQQLISDKERSITGQESELGAMKQALQHRLQDTEFADLHELTEILELMQHQTELERRLAELEQEIDAKTFELEQNKTALEHEQVQLSSDLSPEQLDAELKSVTEKIEIADLERQRLERLLSEHRQFREKADAILVQLREQEEIVRQCKADVAAINEESGISFRRRVQKRMTEQLLSQTNIVLEKISGRYYLRQTPSEQGLALNIEDTYQGNVQRLPKTLSGGESFVVSLSLALGLSELANNGRSVDSLFLDEGFGNLDAETLYTVISTLEGLHHHGKTVGVISHVEGVQKRFKAQLQVVKKTNGMGMLKLVS